MQNNNKQKNKKDTYMSRVSQLIKRFENGGEFPPADEYKAAMEEDIRNPIKLRVEWSNKWPVELSGNLLLD